MLGWFFGTTHTDVYDTGASRQVSGDEKKRL